MIFVTVSNKAASGQIWILSGETLKSQQKMLRDVSAGPVGGTLPSEFMPCCSLARDLGAEGKGVAAGFLYLKKCLFFEVQWGKWQVRRVGHYNFFPLLFILHDYMLAS